MPPEREAHGKETLQDPNIMEGSYPWADAQKYLLAILNAITVKGT